MENGSPLSIGGSYGMSANCPGAAPPPTVAAELVPALSYAYSPS